MTNEAIGPYFDREWLETNGLGSYASASVSGAGTRRYHGLFVAALSPPRRRAVLLSRLEDQLVVRPSDGEAKSFALSTNQYPGTIFPEGFRYVVSFEPRPAPTWHLSVDGIEIERRVWMPHGRQGVVVRYRVLRAPQNVALELRVRPLVAFRGFHEIGSDATGLDPSVEQRDGRIVIRPFARMPALDLLHNAREFEPTPVWYRNFEYREEIARGYPGREDLFSHGEFVFALDPSGREDAFLLATLDDDESLSADDVRTLERREMSRREDRANRAIRTRHVSHTAKPDRWSEAFTARLAEAAEQFLVTGAENRRAIVAGYHWFEDWGRDTFVALPGLALATGRWPLAHELLRAFASYVDEGMVPNRFPDAGNAPEYNTVDAALWFVEAARRCAHDTGDASFVGRELLPRVEQILDGYTHGTRFGIRVDDDGLLTQGADGVALTWMDAIVDGVPVTPRRGKPVEVNALWHNALCAGAEMAASIGATARAESWRGAALRVRERFNARFWNAELGCLYDVVDGPDGNDESIRPNQIFAVSLPFAPLRILRYESVVDTIERRLLTPMGLRTLDPEDPKYRGRYEGGPAERDAAYHNGTVWPWLLGPFATAYLKTHGRNETSLARVRELVTPFAEQLGTAGCLGQISEIADGDAPHTARGCVAQAWSVAELARILLEDLAEGS